MPFESQLAIDLGRLDAILPVGETCVVVFTSGATVTVSKELGDHLTKMWMERLGIPFKSPRSTP